MKGFSVEVKNVKTVEVKKNRTNERKVTSFAVEAIY